MSFADLHGGNEARVGCLGGQTSGRDGKRQRRMTPDSHRMLLSGVEVGGSGRSPIRWGKASRSARVFKIVQETRKESEMRLNEVACDG